MVRVGTGVRSRSLPYAGVDTFQVVMGVVRLLVHIEHYWP